MKTNHHCPAGIGRRRSRMAAWLLAAIITSPATGRACDLCAIYTTTVLQEDQTGLRVGVAEQFTHFGTLKENGHTASNPEDERLDSSITQLIVGYNFVPQAGVQVTLPIVARSYRRVEGDGTESGDESGIGDLSVIGTIAPFSRVYDHGVLRLGLFGGVKFPTGDSDPLGEESEEDHGGEHGDEAIAAGRRPSRARHEMSGDGVMSGIHGHDLARGSGSYDGVLGGQLFAMYRRAFVTASVQYQIRSTGSFQYRYADDLLWSTGPGTYLALGDALWGAPYSAGAQLLLSGETKGKDTLDGASVDDTGITSLFLGPVFSVSWGSRLSADVAVDLPVLQNNTGLQIVPNVRVRSGVAWYF